MLLGRIRRNCDLLFPFEEMSSGSVENGSLWTVHSQILPFDLFFSRSGFHLSHLLNTDHAWQHWFRYTDLTAFPTAIWSPRTLNRVSILQIIRTFALEEKLRCLVCIEPLVSGSVVWIMIAHYPTWLGNWGGIQCQSLMHMWHIYNHEWMGVYIYIYIWVCGLCCRMYIIYSLI